MPSISTTAKKPTTATTITELLNCDGIDFIRSTYKTLLGRDADKPGLIYYNKRFIAGYSKIGLIMQIYTSDEARSRKKKIEGLDTAIEKYKMGKLPILGFIFRAINPSISDSEPHRNIRAIERQLNDLKQECIARFDTIENILKIFSAPEVTKDNFQKIDTQISAQAKDISFSDSSKKSTSDSSLEHRNNFISKMKHREKTPLENFSR